MCCCCVADDDDDDDDDDGDGDDGDDDGDGGDGDDYDYDYDYDDELLQSEEDTTLVVAREEALSPGQDMKDIEKHLEDLPFEFASGIGSLLQSNEGKELLGASLSGIRGRVMHGGGGGLFVPDSHLLPVPHRLPGRHHPSGCGRLLQEGPHAHQAGHPRDMLMCQARQGA